MIMNKSICSLVVVLLLQVTYNSIQLPVIAQYADKIERPQLLLKKGKPTYLYAPARANLNNGNGTVCYLFKIKN